MKSSKSKVGEKSQLIAKKPSFDNQIDQEKLLRKLKTKNSKLRATDSHFDSCSKSFINEEAPSSRSHCKEDWQSSPQDSKFQSRTIDEDQNEQLYSSSGFDNELSRQQNWKLINASARYDLLSAHEQILEFQLNRAIGKGGLREEKSIRDLRLDSQESTRGNQAYENPVQMMKNNTSRMLQN